MTIFIDHIYKYYTLITKNNDTKILYEESYKSYELILRL